MTDNDQAKAFFLSVCLGCIDAVKQGEKDASKKGLLRRKKLKKLEGDIVKVTDLYLPKGGFSPEDMGNAAKLIDELNERIKEMYEP